MFVLAAKLTGYQITVKSAEGKVESEVTGNEEYEIDTFEGLTADTREILIQYKLTTLSDIVRFRDKWVDMQEIADDQRKLLLDKVTEYLEEESQE